MTYSKFDARTIGTKKFTRNDFPGKTNFTMNIILIISRRRTFQFWECCQIKFHKIRVLTHCDSNFRQFYYPFGTCKMNESSFLDK